MFGIPYSRKLGINYYRVNDACISLLKNHILLSLQHYVEHVVTFQQPLHRQDDTSHTLPYLAVNKAQLFCDNELLINHVTSFLTA